MGWGDPGDEAQVDRRGERRGRRWEDELDAHRRDRFAHPPMVDRLTVAGQEIQAGYEMRVSRLERFAARVALLGVLGGIVLGGTAGVIAAKFLHL